MMTFLRMRTGRCPIGATPRGGDGIHAARAVHARRILPSAARTRIIGWMLLFLMAALAIATFATWRLLVSAVNTRMDEALRVEVQEFAELTVPGIDPAPVHRSAGWKN